MTAQACLLVVGMVAMAYLCGALPFGLLIGFARGVDIRKHGSGNIGATNAGRVLGRGYGILAFALDLLKGTLPTLLAGHWLHRLASAGQIDNVWMFAAWLLVAITCVLGHVLPVYLKFKGGKGVATSLGVLLGIYPYCTLAALMAFALWSVLTVVTRYVSLASILAAIGYPIFFVVLASWYRASWGEIGELWPLYLFNIVIAGLVVYRHRSNIQRLLRGEEPRIGVSGGSSA